MDNKITPLIAEQDVKKAALQFLKNYYKYRPRTSEANARMDLLAPNGIAADGHITFKDPMGRPFIATLEATAIETAYEVKYRQQRQLLFWDSVAIACLSSALLLSIGYAYKYLAMKALGVPLCTLSAIFAGLIVFAFYRNLFNNNPRYRKIYAIDQFQQYHANEQWVAIAEDIFEPEDAYLEELKRQCVLNGFGLIVVDTELQAHLHIAPARENVLENKKRPKLVFEEPTLTATEVATTDGSSPVSSIKTKLNNSIEQIQKEVRQNIATVASHSKKRYWSQLGFCALGLLLGSSLLFRQYQDKPIRFVSEKILHDSMELKALKMIPESNQLSDNQSYTPFDKTKAAYIEPTPETVSESVVDGVYLSPSKGEIVFYDCERLDFSQSKYVIQESVLPTLGEAKMRVEELGHKSIQAGCVWVGCMSSEKKGYIVFLDLIFENNTDANTRLKYYQKLLKANHLENKKLKIISLKTIL